MGRESNMLLVNPVFPAKTVPELIAYARANPGKIGMASVGTGSVSHVAGELFKMMTGVDMLHVPYRGGPAALTDLIGGQVQVLFLTTTAAMAHVKSGQVRPLAVTTATRSSALPDIPAMNEFVPGFEASNFYGLGVPRDTPADLIDRLNSEITAVIADPGMQTRLAELGATPMPLSPAAFGKLVADETEKWAKVVRFAGIKPE